MIATTRNAAKATQFCGSEIVKRPCGRQKEVVKSEHRADRHGSETIMPQATETARIASRNVSATVVAFTGKNFVVQESHSGQNAEGTYELQEAV